MQPYNEPIINNNAVATFGTVESNNTRATSHPPPRYRDSYFDRFSNKRFSIYFDEIYR